MAIVNRLLCRFNNDTWFAEDAGSIAQWEPREDMLDLTNDAIDLPDAQRRAANQVARTAQPNTSISAEVKIDDTLIVPGSNLWPFKQVTAPTNPLDGTTDGTFDTEIQAVTLVAGQGNKASATTTLEDRRLILAQYQASMIARAERGTASFQSKTGGTTTAADDFPDINTGKVSPVSGPSWSKPDDITVGRSGKWQSDIRTRLTALRITSDLSGVGDTVCHIVLNGTLLDTFITLVAGGIFAQTIVFDFYIVPTDVVQIECTLAGGHTQVNIQGTCGAAI